MESISTEEVFLEKLQDCVVYEIANPALVSVRISTAAAFLKPGLRSPLVKNVLVHSDAPFSGLLGRSAGSSSSRQLLPLQLPRCLCGVTWKFTHSQSEAPLCPRPSLSFSLGLTLSS